MCSKSKQHIHKQIFNETLSESFRLRLREIKWDNLKTSNDSDLAYNKFLNTLTSLYDDCFFMVKIKVKAQNSFRLWIPKALQSLQRKNKDYMKSI